MYVELKVTREDLHANNVWCSVLSSITFGEGGQIKLRKTPNDACQSLPSFPATYPET